MKRKILVASLLSVLGLAVCVDPASALGWRKHGINRYSTFIMCRPYNAFTPVCSGSLVCDGCCPFACPNVPAGACCSPALANPMLSMAYDPLALQGQYAGAPFATNMPMMNMAMTNAPMPGAMMMPPAGTIPGAPGFMPPQPNVVPAPIPQGSQTYTPSPSGFPVQPVSYQANYPMYYPVYPVQYMPYQQVPVYPQGPAYWYGY